MCSKATYRRVKKSIYGEMPGIGSAGQLWHTGKALRTLA